VEACLRSGLPQDCGQDYRQNCSLDCLLRPLSQAVRRAALAMAVLVALAAVATGHAAEAQRASSCQRLTLAGEASAGHEWRQAVGGGWVLRLAPIVPGAASYTGWDLVMDREPGAGYPDALLLATPPYGSISEREIGTTFGLRAQDAIGWNPRSFRFLTDVAALRQGQQLFGAVAAGQKTDESQRAGQKLMQLALHGSVGQLRIVDARLSAGVADAAPFSENWALQAARTPHSEVPAQNGQATARGSLDWIRFTVTLWMPAGWKTPAGVQSSRAGCQ